MPRTRMSSDDRRAQIIGAGRDVLAVRGWDALSMDEVAEAAGVSKALLYHYFASKRDLYVALLEGGDQDLRSRLALGDELLAPGEQLRRALAAYLDYVEANTAIYTAAVRETVSADPAVRRLVDTTRQRAVKLVLDGIGVGAPSPLLALALRGWIGFVETATIDWVATRAVPREQFAELLATSLRGVLWAVARLEPPAVPAPVPRRRRTPVR